MLLPHSHPMSRLRRRMTAVIALCVLLANFAGSFGADWPMRGRDNSRNSVSPEQSGPIDWQVGDSKGASKNIRWTAQVGSHSCGDPVISGGLVWVGTTNRPPLDKKNADDASVLMCFRERDGQFLYQYVSPRLETRSIDWPYTSLASSPLIEGERLWFCNNRCEVICLDIAPLLSRTGEPRTVWKVDMRSQLGVVPRGVMIGSHASHCSVAAYKDLIYVNTTNGIGPAYDKVPAPEAPSLVCLHKQTGLVRWQDNSPGKDILDAQHGSPLVIEVCGRGQVIMGQGDGWVRGFDALTGEMLWKFDINAKSAKRGFGPGTRSDLVALPVFYDNRVYFAVGRQFEACVGQGRLCCLDPTKRGDISAELNDGLGRGRQNSNSGLVWEYLGKGDQDANRMHCTLSSVVIHNGLLIAPDLSGIVHCVDARTGEKIWTHDTVQQIVASPLIVGDKVYVGTDDGTTFIFELARQKKLIAERDFHDSIEAGPVYANGLLYLMTRNSLFAISEK